MGYTHYFEELKRELTNKEVKIIKKITEVSGVILRGLNGEKETYPKIGNDVIAFNGDREEGYESFWIEAGIKGFNFCKTNRKPYDKVVVAICIYLESLGIFTWSSDGDEADHAEGRALYEKVIKSD